jgi:hypothetical protein
MAQDMPPEVLLAHTATTVAAPATSPELGGRAEFRDRWAYVNAGKVC